MKSLLSAATLLTLLCAGDSAAQAQWQLPPGTSSSVDEGKPVAADAVTVAIAEAEKRIAAQDWAGAAKLLRPVIEHSPGNAHALYDLGYCQESLGDEAGARTSYEHAVAYEANAVPSRVALGLLLARSGDAVEAEKQLSAAVAIPPETGPDSNAFRASADRALARLHLPSAPERSRDDLVAALKLSPETPADMLLAGEIAEALHDDAAAEAAYARSLKASPGDADAAASEGRVLMRLNQPEQAHAVLTAALRLHPQDEGLLREQAALLLQEGKVSDAVPLLEELRLQHPANAATGRLLARAYVAAGEAAKAGALFQQLSQAAPQDGELLAGWADSLIREKKNPEAEALLEKALDAQFPFPQARSQAAAELAFAASIDHHPEVVLRAVNIRNASLPPDASSTFLLATAHDTLHHTRQAAESYRQFLELANGKFPDEEWQAKQRLQILNRAK